MGVCRRKIASHHCHEHHCGGVWFRRVSKQAMPHMQSGQIHFTGLLRTCREDGRHPRALNADAEIVRANNLVWAVHMAYVRTQDKGFSPEMPDLSFGPVDWSPVGINVH